MKEIQSHLLDTPALTPTHCFILSSCSLPVVHGGNALLILGVWVREKKIALGFWSCRILSILFCFGGFVIFF